MPQTWSTPAAPLTVFFWSWKLLLLLVAVVSPGPGYDTSTRILLHRHAAATAASPSAWSARFVEHVVLKLTRWDSIYFATSSARGHLYEQEWAFSQPVAKQTSRLARVLPAALCVSPIISHASAGILISHISHFLAVLTLYQLTNNILPCSNRRKRQIAFTAACIHTVSPGGLFLSSFNGESSFALFNFLGMSSYVAAQKTRRAPFRSAVYTIVSGVLFGVATMIRSNGLLSGLILALDAIAFIPKLPTIMQQQAWYELARLGATLIGGLLIAAAYAQPQLEAYSEYCMNGNTREWCQKLVPSIYTWVQSHYWGVGFLRYWTFSNVPLFLIAVPMIAILLRTAWAAMSTTQLVQYVSQINAQDKSQEQVKASEIKLFTQIMPRLGLPQLVLAILATTNFHVQIINRISSGYPIWCIVLAVTIHTTNSKTSKGSPPEWPLRNAQWIIRASVMYAIVQGGLYASFLPPA